MRERRVNLLVYSLSLHRHSYIGFILAFASSIHNKQTTSDSSSAHHAPHDHILLLYTVSEFSLSLYRHPFIYSLFTSHFTLIINNKIQFLWVSFYWFVINQSVSRSRFIINNSVFSISRFTINNWVSRPHPHSRIHAGSVVSSVSDQVSFLQRDHETRYQTYYFFYPHNPVYTRCLDPSVIEFSLSLHRHPIYMYSITWQPDWWSCIEIKKKNFRGHRLIRKAQHL